MDMHGVRTGCLVNSCRGEIVESFILKNYSMHQYALVLEVSYFFFFCLDGAEIIVNLGKVNTIPCMYCCSLLDSECMQELAAV